MDTHASFNEEEELIQHCESNTSFIVDDITFGKGTLYVAESKLYWKNNTNSQVISIDYKSMCMFGTCNHPTIHEKPCIQIMVDFTYKPDHIEFQNGQTQNGNNDENNSDHEEADNVEENEDDEDEIKSKIKLVPDNPVCLAEIYEAFTRVQPLHNSNDGDTEEDDDFYYNDNEEFEDFDENDPEHMMN